MEISIKFNFFSENGASIDAKIKEALKLLKSSNDYILLEDGTKCYNAHDIKKAIEKRNIQI